MMLLNNLGLFDNTLLQRLNMLLIPLNVPRLGGIGNAVATWYGSNTVKIIVLNINKDETCFMIQRYRCTFVLNETFVYIID